VRKQALADRHSEKPEAADDFELIFRAAMAAIASFLVLRIEPAHLRLRRSVPVISGVGYTPHTWRQTA